MTTRAHPSRTGFLSHPTHAHVRVSLLINVSAPPGPKRRDPQLFSQVQDCPSEAPQISAFITVLRPARARPARESQLLSLFCDRAGLDLPESRLLSLFCDRPAGPQESPLFSMFWRPSGSTSNNSWLLSLFPFGAPDPKSHHFS